MKVDKPKNQERLNAQPSGELMTAVLSKIKSNQFVDIECAVEEMANRKRKRPAPPTKGSKRGRKKKARENEDDPDDPFDSSQLEGDFLTSTQVVHNEEDDKGCSRVTKIGGGENLEDLIGRDDDFFESRVELEDEPSAVIEPKKCDTENKKNDTTKGSDKTSPVVSDKTKAKLARFAAAPTATTEPAAASQENSAATAQPKPAALMVTANEKCDKTVNKSIFDKDFFSQEDDDFNL